MAWYGILKDNVRKVSYTDEMPNMELIYVFTFT